MECRADTTGRTPSADDVGVDGGIAAEMTAVGGTKLSTDADGGWLAEQAWYNVPLILGTAGGGVVTLPDGRSGRTSARIA